MDDNKWIEDESKENAEEIQKEFSKLFLSRKEAQVAGIILRWGGIDGGHHKQWTMDQCIRLIFGDEYERFVAFANDGEDGPDTYDWDEGIAP